jgi:hypothetical protein
LTPQVRIAPTAIRIRLRMIPMGSLFPEPTQRKRPKETPDAPGRIRTSDPRLRRPLLFR